VNNLWWKLFWRTALRITGAGFIFGSLYAPIFYTLIFAFNLLFNRSSYGTLAAILGFYILSVVLGAVFGCIFGTILGAILGIIQGVATLMVVRFFFFPPQDEIQLKYSLIGSGLIVSVIVSYIYFAKYLPGMSGIMLIIPLMIAVIANVWITRKMGEWYLDEVAFFASSTDGLESSNASREP
jgi:hypothetical protein